MTRWLPWRANVTPVLQMESAECGVACLAMVLGYHGCWIPLCELRELCGTSRDGNSAFTLLQGARSLGLDARGVKAVPAQLSSLHLPAILHWELNHFVVLERVHRAGVTIIDPVIGRRIVSNEQVDRCFTGVALILKRGPALRGRKRRSLSFERYRSALFRAKSTLGIVLFGNLTSQLLALTFPAASQFLVDQVVLPTRRQWMLPVLVVMALGGVGQVTLALVQRKSQALLHATLGLELTSELGQRLLSLPLPFLECRSQGDLASRIQQQNSLQALVSRIVQGVFDVLLLGLLTALMLGYHFRLGLLALSLIALRIAIIRRFRLVSEHNFSAELAARGREQSAFIEAIASPEVVRGLNLEESVAKRYEARFLERARVTICSQLLEKRLTACLSMLTGVMQASVLWYGGQLVIRGEMSVGVFAGFLAIRQMLEAPLGALVSLFERLIEMRGAFERSDEVFNVEPERFGERSAADVRGRIELRNVSFRYGSGSPWVLRNVSMTIEPGEHVVIVGPSGGGKSTLGKLICAVLRPTEGEVLLDGHAMATYKRASLAAQFGVVLQEPLILAGTIADALRVRLPEATPEMMERAAELAEFQLVVQRMLQGDQAKLLARGANLSGGERQRLAIAQAYVGEPAVLLLDEATCALDSETERTILDRLDRLPATIISIAHQKNVIARARRILHVDGGAVNESTAQPTPQRNGHGRAVEARQSV